MNDEEYSFTVFGEKLPFLVVINRYSSASRPFIEDKVNVFPKKYFKML